MLKEIYTDYRTTGEWLSRKSILFNFFGGNICRFKLFPLLVVLNHRSLFFFYKKSELLSIVLREQFNGLFQKVNFEKNPKIPCDSHSTQVKYSICTPILITTRIVEYSVQGVMLFKSFYCIIKTILQCLGKLRVQREPQQGPKRIG